MDVEILTDFLDLKYRHSSFLIPKRRFQHDHRPPCDER